MRFHFSSSSPLSILSIVLGFFLLFYFWLPLLIIFIIGTIIFIGISYLIAKFNPPSDNIHIKVIKVHRPEEQDSVDYIDSTTADKDQPS
ncbi:MAG: hypothetical protein ACRC0X_04260 [Brevinema sp.]